MEDGTDGWHGRFDTAWIVMLWKHLLENDDADARIHGYTDTRRMKMGKQGLILQSPILTRNVSFSILSVSNKSEKCIASLLY